MKLLISLTSPFARKARMTAIVKGLAGRLSEEVVNPSANPPLLTDANPLSQVPAEMKGMMKNMMKGMTGGTK